MATPLEIKNSIKENLSDLIAHIGNWHFPGRGNEIDDIKEAIGALAFEVDRLLNIVQVPLDTMEIEAQEQIPLKAAPFQAECKCKVVRNEDGSFIIYHCQYHRSVAYVYDELVDISGVMRGASLIVELLSFLDVCKKNSLTGRIGKARDENVGR